ncbi:MAG: tRNA pseudouridine(38-40) synthase TruA [Clostridiales bacterium]|nr:tRNA pseudouridine(38-40) synthase TruA [Clostridiales bacterium]
MKYVLKVCYDGTSFGGWQIQNNAVTVQQRLEEAFEKAFSQQVNITASGRTDAGVHAAGQVCHFTADLTIPPEKIADALNCFLPKEISVLASAKAPENFDANRSAKRKTYCYNAYFSPRKNPLKDRFSTWVKGDADIQKLRHIATLFIGEHDFIAYMASRSQVKTTVRTIYSIDIEESITYGSKNIKIFVCGNGFLYNMVRTIAGTLIGYAQGRISEEQVKKSLTEKNRNLVGKTMPPNGLTLEDVEYGINLFNG